MGRYESPEAAYFAFLVAQRQGQWKILAVSATM